MQNLQICHSCKLSSDIQPCLCVIINACVDFNFLVPNMMPLGSPGGCQTTLTDVSRTSGNNMRTGGPGTAREKGEKRRLNGRI